MPGLRVRQVPVRATTRGPGFHWFGYYDKLIGTTSRLELAAGLHALVDTGLSTDIFCRPRATVKPASRILRKLPFTERSMPAIGGVTLTRPSAPMAEPSALTPRTRVAAMYLLNIAGVTA